MNRPLVKLFCAALMLTSLAGCGNPKPGTHVSSQSSKNPEKSSAPSSQATVSSAAPVSSAAAAKENSAPRNNSPKQGSTSTAPIDADNTVSSIFPITPTMSAQMSAARINNRASSPAVMLQSEKFMVYPFHAERAYNHHPEIILFKGKLYASWSNGYENEDDCGQRVMMSVSSNGTDWSTPQPLVDTVKGAGSERVLTACGFYTDGNTLCAYYDSFEYNPGSLRGPNLRPLKDGNHTDDRMYVITTTDGVNWSAPKLLPIVPSYNQAPERTSTGRLVLCGAVTFPYCDDPTGLEDWYDTMLSQAGRDDAAKDGANTLCEGSFFETKDHILHMMLRTNSDYLFSCESYDNGASWTNPYKTNFTDGHSKFYFNTLPDGRFYYVGNTDFNGGARNPLMLCVSTDGINFNKRYIIRNEPYTIQKQGLYKNGNYAYPHACVKDNYLYVIYSKGKETIEVTRFPLNQL